MKICLINPYLDMSEDYYTENMTILPPLGLGYLAAALAEGGHEVEIVDCTSACPLPVATTPDRLLRLGHGNEEILRRVGDFRPDVVGISCSYTVHAPECFEIARLIKDGYAGDVPVIVGGAHCSNSPADVLRVPDIDFIVKGEGEHTLVSSAEPWNPARRLKGSRGSSTGAPTARCRAIPTGPGSGTSTRWPFHAAISSP